MSVVCLVPLRTNHGLRGLTRGTLDGCDNSLIVEIDLVRPHEEITAGQQQILFGLATKQSGRPVPLEARKRISIDWRGMERLSS